MIALTQEKREELIQYAKFTSAQYDHDEVLCEIMEIALTALTALPEYYQLRGNDNGWTGFISLDAMIMAERAGIETRSLYTIHPVPEIKFGSETDCEEGLKKHGLKTKAEGFSQIADGFRCGFAWREHIIKRLNGLGE